MSISSIFLAVSGSSFWEKLAQWYQNSVFGELMAYFYERYFRLEFGAYNHFSISERGANTLNKIIIGLIFGCIFAAVYTVYQKKTVGAFVRKLLKSEAFSAESSKNLLDLEEFRSTVVRRELAKGTFLRKVVRCREEEAFYAALRETTDTAQEAGKGSAARSPYAKRDKEHTFRMDFTTAHFYIPEDLKYRAELRFDQKGSSWLFVLLTAVLTPVIASLICQFLPDILQMCDNLITFLAP